MGSEKSGYAQSQGTRLLEQAEQQFGPIFTLEQLKPLVSGELSDSHLRFLISALASAGWIEIIKRGTYVVQSGLFAGDISPFAVAEALVQPMMISHWSACAHHGFTTQLPNIVQATTPKQVITPEMRKGPAYRPRGRSVWRACGWEIEFIHIKQARFWGFETIWANAWQQVRITDPERTALDLIARPDIFGGVAAAIEILDNGLVLVDIRQLVAYAIRYDTGSVIKRLGWVLQELGVESSLLQPLQRFPVRRYYSLDPARNPSDRKNAFWQIKENLGGY